MDVRNFQFAGSHDKSGVYFLCAYCEGSVHHVAGFFYNKGIHSSVGGVN